MKPGELAESIIDGFMIRDPRDIDVEAIAIDAEMQVQFRKLNGCSATLLGIGDRAIATISPSGNKGRDRFSIGHEFGHWSMHRGQSFYCRAQDFGNYTKADKRKEKQADEFSAHLLMPTSLLRPKIGKLRVLSLDDINGLAEDFSTSDAAMAFRVTLMDDFPVILCCYSAEGWEWSLPAPMVPSRWKLKQKLDDDTFAIDYVRGRNTTSGSGKQPADVWFENSDAHRYEIREECIPYRSGQVLVLLYLQDEMLDATRDWDDWRTRYRR
ncbi:MAG: ImmA/IrrE family metallo-endopeptidase [Gammaproteobacteria bacterium]|nr:ImmA/IrrE family metallo-endopeptidase [Gammaproteobacteria bacterium]